MNTNKIINDILDREGQGTPPFLTKGDAGGRTSWGMSEKAHPELWKPGPPTRDQAFATLQHVYVMPFFGLQGVAGDNLIAALVDAATMSGVDEATKHLQLVLGLVADGIIGKATVCAVKTQPQGKLLQLYVRDRTLFLCRLVENQPSDLVNLVGWVTRTLLFLPEAA